MNEERKKFAIRYALISGLAIVLVFTAFFTNSFLNQRAHDQTVIAEVDMIRSALEYFNAVNTFYPKAEKTVELNSRDALTQRLCLQGFASYIQPCEKVIMSFIPNYYALTGEKYTYLSGAKGDNYAIQLNLLGNYRALGLLKGPVCATREGFAQGLCENN